MENKNQNNMELKENNIYIFKKKRHSPSPFKGKVLELTVTTVRVRDLDNNITFRETLEEFNKRWEISEVLIDAEKEIEDLIKGATGTTTKKATDIVITGTCNNRVCHCDGSCIKNANRESSGGDGYIFWNFGHSVT